MSPTSVEKVPPTPYSCPQLHITRNECSAMQAITVQYIFSMYKFTIQADSIFLPREMLHTLTESLDVDWEIQCPPICNMYTQRQTHLIRVNRETTEPKEHCYTYSTNIIQFPSWWVSLTKEEKHCKEFRHVIVTQTTYSVMSATSCQVLMIWASQHNGKLSYPHSVPTCKGPASVHISLLLKKTHSNSESRWNWLKVEGNSCGH